MDYKRQEGESMYSWVDRIAPSLAELSAFDLKLVLFNIVSDCYVRGSKEALYRKRHG